jgi:hypothetical protein
MTHNVHGLLPTDKLGNFFGPSGTTKSLLLIGEASSEQVGTKLMIRRCYNGLE